MTVTTKVLIRSKVAEDVQYIQYTVGSFTTIVDKFTAVNFSTLPVEIKVYLVAFNDSVGDHNLASVNTVPPNGVCMFPELVGHTLMQGGFISTIAGTADAINIRASGREIS